LIGATIAAFDVLFPVLAATSFSALAYKLRDLRRDSRNVALRALCASRATTGLAYVFLTPALYTRLDDALGTHNLGTLASNSCIISSALATQLMLLHWFHDPATARRRARWLYVLFAGVLLAMVALFVSAAPPGEHPVDFEVRFAGDPEATAYLAVYLGAYGANLITTARRTWPPSSVIDRPWLRRGLRLTAVGSLFVLGYLAGKVLGVAGRWAGTGALDVAAVLVAPALASVGSVVLVVGNTFPGWGQRLAAHRSRARSFRRIYPLWKALCDAAPGVALYAPRSRYPPRFVRDPELRLYRAVIEIHDCRRVLRRYRDAHIGRAAREAGTRAGLGGTELRALVEAATIKAAIRAKLAGRAPDREEDAPADAGGGAGEELGSEVSWLEKVAQAFSEPPPDTSVRA
jgi:hypothetical protein